MVGKFTQFDLTLHEKYSELELIYSSAPLGLCYMDTDLRFLRCNAKLAKINGHTVEEHIGRTLHEIVPEIAETMEQVYYKVIETCEPVVDILASMKSADGTRTRHFSACYYPVLREDGSCMGVSSIVQEVTDRIESEIALTQFNTNLEGLVREQTDELRAANVKLNQEHVSLLHSEHRLRQLVESTRAIPWEANAKTWQFTYVGPQAYEVFGYPIEDWYEADFWINHLHAPDRDRAIHDRLQMSKQLDDHESSYRMNTAEGGVVWLHDIIRISRNEGEGDTLHGFLIDVSEQHKISEKMRYAEKEASLHRERLAHVARVHTVSEMASGIVHEINQPLAAIESYAQASRKYLATEDHSHKIEELLLKIANQAARAGSIVNRLRTLMKHRSVSCVPLNFSLVMSEVAEIAELDAKHHGCHLSFEMNGSLPKVMGDPVQIQQVVLNFIRNAIDELASLDELAVKEISVETSAEHAEEIKISVTDSGPGISADIEKLFEAFYTTKKSGLGMGLAICQNIIESHGGTIGYSKNDLNRTVFYFTLPAEIVEE